ncbi:hypothetical protein EZS27_015224, partial [termite gut metagenome]
MKKSFLITTILWLDCFVVHSQTLEAMQQTIDYRIYIEWVWQQNLGYAAEKLNVSVAEAEVKAARIFNDPAISMEYADNDDHRMQMGRSVSVELSRSFSLGKRSAGIGLAESEKELAEALLEDYFHTLRVEASLAYLETIRQSELYRVKESSYESIRRLAEGDSIKYALGKITYTDAVQSKLEAGMAYNDLMQAQTELYNSRATALKSILIGKVLPLPYEKIPIRVFCRSRRSSRTKSLSSLIIGYSIDRIMHLYHRRSGLPRYASVCQRARRSNARSL